MALMLPSRETLSGTQPSWRVEEIKPVLERVASRRRHTDKIYVFYGAAQAMRFYAPRYGFSESSWTRGNANRKNPQLYLLELDQFRGEPRVWIIISHDVIPGERALITGFLDSVGQRIVGENFPVTRADSGTAALLYDLSETKTELHR